MVFAGFALTCTSLPKIIFLPALVAGLLRVLMRATPGIVKTPLDFTSVDATSARPSKSFATTPLFSSSFDAKASQRAPLLMLVFDLPAFMAFMAFIAFMGAMLGWKG